jgi:hypothetical protein
MGKQNKKGKRARRNKGFADERQTQQNSGSDLITGNWTWDGGDVVTGRVTSGKTEYQTYFGILEAGIGSDVSFSGYGDSNGNGSFDRGQDVLVGSASLNVFATSPAYSGTWDASAVSGIANGYVGNNLIATATGVGFWFS